MADQSIGVEGAVAALVGRAIDAMTRALTDRARLDQLVSTAGLTGDAASTAIDALEQAAASVTDLQQVVDRVIALLASGRPDPVRLLGPAKDAWEGFTDLLSTLGDIELPDVPAGAPPVPGIPKVESVGDVLELALAQALDDVVRDLNGASWAFLRTLGVIDPLRSPIATLEGLVSKGLGWLREQYAQVRRSTDILVAGVLTGPRVTSVVSVPLDDAVVVPADVLAKVDGTPIVWQRFVVRIAADTFDDPHPITIDLLGTRTAPPTFSAVVLRTPGIAGGRLALGRSAGIRVTGADEVGLVITSKSVEPLSGAPTVTLDAKLPAGFTFGTQGSMRLIVADPVFEVGVDGASRTYSLRAGYRTFEASVPSTAFGSVLAMVLPLSGITLRGSFVFVLDEGGVHLEGGVGLTVTYPDVVRLAGAAVRDLTTGIEIGGTDASSLGLSASGTVSAKLGPLAATVAGLGVTVRARITTDGSGNLGVLNLEPLELAPITGIGLAIDTPLIRGGGFLELKDGEARGALELALRLGSVELTVQAFGVFTTVDGALSFVVVITAQFTPAIELFLGLTLNGVGGVFGVNRGIDQEQLKELVRSGRIDDILFPRDLIARAPEVIQAVKAVFPAQRDQFVIGPILKLGWGRPVSFVTVTVGLVFSLPRPAVFAIVGTLRVSLPTPDAAVIDINAQFAGAIDFTNGDVFFMASLVRSRIGFFEVSGDLALQAGSKDFVFTAGGYHPSYTGPKIPGEIRRLAIQLSPSPILTIRAEAYFALTASTVQFGGGLYVRAKLGPIGARGSLTADVLIQTSPRFSFIAQLHGSFALTYSGEDILTAELDVLLEGPDRWHARARASITFLCFSVSGTLELEWGSKEAALTAGPPVDVAEAVRTALRGPKPEEPKPWPIGAPTVTSGVLMRDGAPQLHPLGFVRISQTVAPVNTELARFGTNPIAGPTNISFAAGATLAQRPVEELFAPAQYFSLSDDERLSRPAFVPMSAGVIVEDPAWRVKDARQVTVTYEEDLGAETPEPGRPKRLFELDEEMLVWANAGSVGAVHEAAAAAAASVGIHVRESAYTVATADAGPVGGAPLAAADVVGVRSLLGGGQTVFADYEAVLMGRAAPA
ncbi:DUF6603 domain-containing protein [Microbacterium sp. NPDC058389]|uniref:DUF6603 domain-containing protein n=1 Tax=Microbacterium sp. NPDC058389 TaxID=3346475 RepID=UPI00364F9900